MYELKNIRWFKNKNWKKIEIFIKLKKRLIRVDSLVISL